MTKSLKEEDLMKIDPGYLKILEEIFAKETKNQLGRKSTVRILSENALTGKEIIF
ncbi:hypothetical protein LF887_15385 [Chryseobacterium sp. MEBOG06]|uniref:hypothetical protein n=1 Tax=Chryseobacterium sp. MEBOG06 TaxID=2879938 RepID=UPI001F3D022E|nr:hypothetical protein [Chryseobacterium sp. MEBOG06]UKB82387.1 hypothetical protein LF887_15385 [Chryseobacterium sp. MEBOG06]